jgi:hypothetical protein
MQVEKGFNVDIIVDDQLGRRTPNRPNAVRNGVSPVRNHFNHCLAANRWASSCISRSWPHRSLHTETLPLSLKTPAIDNR